MDGPPRPVLCDLGVRYLCRKILAPLAKTLAATAHEDMDKPSLREGLRPLVYEPEKLLTWFVHKTPLTVDGALLLRELQDSMNSKTHNAHGSVVFVAYIIILSPSALQGILDKLNIGKVIPVEDSQERKIPPNTGRYHHRWSTKF
eukprot:5570308-Amphidinium_carterae.1